MSLNSFKNLSKSISKNLPIRFPINTEKVASTTISNVKYTILQNITIILIIFFTLLIFTIFVSVFDLSFKEKEFVKDKAYILEGIANENDLPESPMKLAKEYTIKESCKKKDRKILCSKNTDLKSCGDFSCCAWINYKKGAKCEPGSATGPEIFKYDKKGELGYDHYYYKNKKYDA
mgnify:CR=1 FL=1